MSCVTKRVQREYMKIEDITCDVCGKSCKLGPYIFECATLNASWGYMSHKDGCEDEAHLCESCFDKIVEHFKIKLHNPNEPYDADE